MQVAGTVVNQNITVNTESKNFSISDSAQFFHILSDSLYSDKAGAVVRELICNADDAQIKYDPEVPIRVEVTDNFFKVRDFASGIDPEKMQEIYCTYGNTTKINDKTQTGGFGLGCKSPFAVTDSFTVISYYKGTEYTYLLFKDKETGIPKFSLLGSEPTEEHGLEVVVPISVPWHWEEKVQALLTLGDINAERNFSRWDNIPPMKYKKFFVDVSHAYSSMVGRFPRKVYVRYGKVIYPVDNQKFQYPNPDFDVFLQADPDTLDITPSRESLAYTEKTFNTLAELFKRISWLRKGNTLEIAGLYGANLLCEKASDGINEDFFTLYPEKDIGADDNKKVFDQVIRKTNKTYYKFAFIAPCDSKDLAQRIIFKAIKKAPLTDYQRKVFNAVSNCTGEVFPSLKQAISEYFAPYGEVKLPEQSIRLVCPIKDQVWVSKAEALYYMIPRVVLYSRASGQDVRDRCTEVLPQNCMGLVFLKLRKDKEELFKKLEGFEVYDVRVTPAKKKAPKSSIEDVGDLFKKYRFSYKDGGYRYREEKPDFPVEGVLCLSDNFVHNAWHYKLSKVVRELDLDGIIVTDNCRAYKAALKFFRPGHEVIAEKVKEICNDEALNTLYHTYTYLKSFCTRAPKLEPIEEIICRYCHAKYPHEFMAYDQKLYSNMRAYDTALPDEYCKIFPRTVEAKDFRGSEKIKNLLVQIENIPPVSSVSEEEFLAYLQIHAALNEKPSN